MNLSAGTQVSSLIVCFINNMRKAEQKKEQKNNSSEEHSRDMWQNLENIQQDLKILPSQFFIPSFLSKATFKIYNQ